MIAITIIGIIIGIIIINYVHIPEDSRIEKARTDISMLIEACKKYNELTGNWPDSIAELQEKGIVTKIPDDPWGDSYKLDKCMGLIGTFRTSDTEDKDKPEVTGRFKPQVGIYLFDTRLNTLVLDANGILLKRYEPIRIVRNKKQNYFIAPNAVTTDTMGNIYVVTRRRPREIVVFSPELILYEQSINIRGVYNVQVLPVEFDRTLPAMYDICVGNPLKGKGTGGVASMYFVLSGTNEITQIRRNSAPRVDAKNREVNLYTIRELDFIDVPAKYGETGDNYEKIVSIDFKGDLYVLYKRADADCLIVDPSSVRVYVKTLPNGRSFRATSPSVKKRVSAEITEGIKTDIAVSDKGKIFIATSNGYIFALDPQNAYGEEIVDSIDAQMDISKIAVDEFDYIYALGDRGRVIAIFEFKDTQNQFAREKDGSPKRYMGLHNDKDAIDLRESSDPRVKKFSAIDIRVVTSHFAK